MKLTLGEFKRYPIFTQQFIREITIYGYFNEIFDHKRHDVKHIKDAKELLETGEKVFASYS